MIFPEVLFARYDPPRATKPSPYRTATFLDSPSEFRNEASEQEAATRFLDALESAWADGARALLVLGSNMFYALGFKGSFKEFRGSALSLGAQWNPKGHAWTVIATIDPHSKAAYIRNGYGTYKSDLAKAIAAARGTAAPVVERFTLGPDLNAILHWLAVNDKASTVAVDIESDGLEPHAGADIVCIGIASSCEDAVCIPMRKARGISWWSAAEEALLQNRLVRFLNGRRTVWHNGLYFDIPFMILKGLAVDPNGDIWDTMFMHRDIEPDSPHSLAYISSRFCTRPYWKEDFKTRIGSIYAMDPIKMWTYNARDCVATFESYDVMLSKVSRGFSMQAAPLLIAKRLRRLVLDDDDLAATLRDVEAAKNAIEHDLRQGGALPPEFNFASAVHMNAFVFGLKRMRTEMQIVSESEAEATRITERLTRFDAEHATMSPAKRLSEKARFERMLLRKNSTARYLSAKAHVDLMNAIRPLYDIKRLSFTPKISQNGLYSLDDLTRERLAKSLDTKCARLVERLAIWRSTPKGKERFIASSQSELESAMTLREWLSLYQERQDLMTFADSLRAKSDITSMPLEMLERFGSRVRPAIGCEFAGASFADVTSSLMARLAKSLSKDQFPIVLSQKCVILEVPTGSKVETASIQWTRASTLSDIIRRISL